MHARCDAIERLPPQLGLKETQPPGIQSAAATVRALAFCSQQPNEFSSHNDLLRNGHDF
jgi:hypothetical protein